MLVALVLLACAVTLGYLELPEDQPGTLSPSPGDLV